MTEIEATVESEFVPAIKWPERVLITAESHNNPGYFSASAVCVDEAQRHAEKHGLPYRILRVQPPVERRVVLEVSDFKEEFERTFKMPCGYSDQVFEMMWRHARIVEVKKI